jgi:3-methyladenine DNA glycosylase AlkD
MARHPSTTSVASPTAEGARQASRALHALADPGKAAFSAGFFKTGKGEYGEGDRFLGIAVPAVRRVARQYQDLPLSGCRALLESPFNEERLLALLILVGQYRRGDAPAREAIYRAYLAARARVNNWNLVDSSAPYILGPHLRDRPRQRLDRLAASRSLWDRRIAVLASFAFIREGDFSTTLRLTARLLRDPEDLLHKACGWMLREVGKRDREVLEGFLRRHHARMPRTLLRYAIERLPEARRRAWLAGREAKAVNRMPRAALLS